MAVINYRPFVIAKANVLIKTMNRKIVKINSELKDANQIKDNYVSLYMKLSTQYIRQVDEERSHLRKIAKTDGMEKVNELLPAQEHLRTRNDGSLSTELRICFLFRN